MTEQALIETITGFLAALGIAAEAGAVREDALLPGIDVVGDRITYDAGRLQWPGDLLHEAGHVAVAEPGVAHEEGVSGEPALEMAALAWSYAAALALGIDPLIVFHEGGYRGGGAGLAAQYATGFGPGVPMLDWFGMTGEGGFPAMARWVR